MRNKQKDIKMDPVIDDEGSHLGSDISQEELRETMSRVRSIVCSHDDTESAKAAVLQEAKKYPKNKAMLFAFLGGDQIHEEFVKSRLYRKHIVG